MRGQKRGDASTDPAARRQGVLLAVLRCTGGCAHRLEGLSDVARHVSVVTGCRLLLRQRFKSAWDDVAGNICQARPYERWKALENDGRL